ncbi:MAG: rRNA maturation RNase YbeY [Bacteroidales bacterium]|nr:rRNA maturation RNase YbeY [Bacteroidales bacterium]
MAISFSTQGIEFALDEEQKVKKWIAAIINAHNMTVGVISYLFCSDDVVLEANRSFLDHDTYTDIITFDYVEGTVVSGDIMISIDRVRENATIFNAPFEHELKRVIIHGILHLLGQKDKSEEDAAQMRKREEEALQLWKTMD